MLSGTESRILGRLFDDLTRTWTIREMSLDLGMPYPQAHRSVKLLSRKGLILKEKKGKSSLIGLNLKSACDDYITVENRRKEEIKEKYKVINVLEEDLSKVRYNQYICILFGSYAEKKAKKGSDIDLLFVIPEQFNYAYFERDVKDKVLLSNADISITTEKGLLEMWYNPSKLNVGNELLRKHIILKGAEAFLNLRRIYHMGDK